MATLAIYDGTTDDAVNFGKTPVAYSQGFKIPAGSTITGFSYKGSKGNTTPCSNFTAKIYEGGTTPSNGTLKKSESFSSTSLGAYTPTPSFHDFTFATDTGALTGGTTKYYIIWSADDGTGTDVIRTSADYNSSYADGSYRTTSDGTTWSAESSHNLNFKIYGTEPATTNIKSIDGLAIGSVKSVNGLAIGSVKNINGLV